MDVHDGEYYHRRAEAELRMAQGAVTAEAKKAHDALARHYLERASQSPKPTSASVISLPER